MKTRTLFWIWSAAVLVWLLMLIPFAVIRIIETPIRLWQEVSNQTERAIAIRELKAVLAKRIEQERLINEARSRLEVN